MNPRVKYKEATGKSAYRYETEDGHESGETHEYVAWLEKEYTRLTTPQQPEDTFSGIPISDITGYGR